jgi:hypothetical protein
MCKELQAFINIFRKKEEPMGTKILSFMRRRPPSDPPFGYSDPCTLLDGEGYALEKVDGRSTPNGFRLSDHKPWDACFSCIAPGTYDAVYMFDSRGKLCFIINEGKEIPAVLPNANHEYRCVVSSAEVHAGYAEDNPATPQNEDNPGSMACCTIKKTQWQLITKHFKIGEKCKVEIKTL